MDFPWDFGAWTFGFCFGISADEAWGFMVIDMDWNMFSLDS